MLPAFLGLLCLAGIEIVVSQELPYNPTFALVSANPDTIYLLSPTSDGSTFQLSSVNASSRLSTSDLSATTLSATLPFDLTLQTALVASADEEDTLYLLSGTCENGAQGTGLWTYNTSTADSQESKWIEKSIDTSKVEDAPSNGGLNFLGATITFSGGRTAGPDLYLFGGLCPNSTSLTAENWQSSASYSNNMLILQSSSDSQNHQYAISNVVNRGPPIPEAGFSVTPLQPAYLNSSDASSKSQQNYAFIGGQTSNAFINMSQVALFSLPEESWSFIHIDAPTPISGSGATIQTSSAIDPRSGHAAAISSDGRRIVVVGGWVGDVATAADPQLLILEVGDGYGGAGEWQWSIPSEQNGGPAGIYGHAAVMLPGDVLMITGGYAIGSEKQRQKQRRAASTGNTLTYFYNISSNSWIANYQNPHTNDSASSVPAKSSGQDSATKLGLGVGLGLGIPLLVALLALALYRWRWRNKRQRDAHDLQTPAASPTYQYHLPGTGGIDGRGGRSEAGPAMQQAATVDPYPWAPAPASAGNLAITRGSEAERTGLLYDIPSPTRGLRRSLHSRSTNYWYEDGRRSRGSGHIHPINEEDEGGAPDEGQNVQSGQNLIQLNDDIVTSAPVLDPFADGHERSLLDGSRSPSPQSPAQEREIEFRGWMNGWRAAENRRQQQSGRVSPEKSDRTSSSLSDSARSAVSALSYQPSVDRSSSQRSAALLAANVLPHSQRVSPPDSPVSPITPNQHRRSQSANLGRWSGNGGSASSGPSFHRLQAEGQALLGGTPPQPESPSARSQNRAKTWMGSVRRALTGGNQRSSIASPERSPPEPEQSTVQRSASAGSMLWRRRQGARDWDYEGSPTGPGSSTAHGPEDEDWDVESAVERRVVQVMFTVPRERLRVVNAGPPGDSSSIASVEDPLIDKGENNEEGRGDQATER